MNLLFVHRSFPGQFLWLLQALAATQQHRIVFISRPAGFQLSGVNQVTYSVTPASSRTHADAVEFDAAMRRAVAVAEVASGLRSAGFHPDLIIGHEGWGETLNLCDVWPNVPQLGYREYFYHVSGADVGCDPEFPVQPSQLAGVRAKNAVGTLALLQQTLGASPTEWQRSLYPAWSRPGITPVPDGVDLSLCTPDAAARSRPFELGDVRIGPEQPVVTFVARDLEPYRGFHTLIRSLPRLMARPDVRVLCLGGDGVTYGLRPLTGTWRGRLLAEVAGKVDVSRLHFPGQVSYNDYLRVLQRSDIHTYLSYPFIASWSLREALACGCTVVAADTAPVREFISDGVTGRLIRPLDPGMLADVVLELLDDPGRRRSLGTAARAWASIHLPRAHHLAAWGSLMAACLGTDPASIRVRNTMEC